MGDKQRAMTRNKLGPQFMVASCWWCISPTNVVWVSVDFERRMSNLVQNKWMHIMNIFPFVWVRYIMYYYGKHGGRLVILWIQWYVIQAELVELAHVSNQANFPVTCTVFITMFNNHQPLLCERYPMEQIALRDDKLETSIQKTPFSLTYPL